MHINTKEFYAAKYINFDNQTDKYINREVSLLLNLSHPNIMKIRKDFYV